MVLKKDVFEWFVSLQREFQNNSSHVVEKFKLKFLSPDIELKSDLALYTKIHRLVEKVKKLKGNKSKNLEKVLNELFEIPVTVGEVVATTQPPLVVSSSSNINTVRKEARKELSSLKKENSELKRKILDYEDLTKQYQNQMSDLSEVNIELKSKIKTNDVTKGELDRLRVKYQEKVLKLDEVESKFHAFKSKYDIKNINKKIKYRESQVNSKKEEIKDIKKQYKILKATTSKEINNLLSSIEESNMNIDSLKKEKQILQKKVSRYKTLLSRDRQFIEENNLKEIQDMQDELDLINKKFKDLSSENNDLEKLVALLEDEEIVTFNDGMYCNEVREVIMELLSLNVSMKNVNSVIKTVLNKLAKKNVSRLPSTGVKNRIMQEALIISQFQVAEAMLEGDVEDNIGNCLHGDGTSKYHRHFQNFQITTNSGKTLSFGLSEIAGGDAGTVMKSFTDSIDDLCDVISNDDEAKQLNFSKLISSIKTTMSDLGPVNPLFNSQLKAVREKLLPLAISNWENLSLIEQSEMKEMGNFFCKLHLLANFASETDKVLNSFEKLILNDNYETVFAFSTKESGAVRLVRTACKAFHSRGSDEAGVASYFNSFLAGKGEIPYLAPFIGNRFNILFYNAAALYFHKNSIISFLNSWPNPNNLLKAVKEDISNKIFLAEVRALGIIDKLLTGPFWRLIESLDNILQINPYLLRLKLKLCELCKDSSSIFQGKQIFDLNDKHIVIHEDVLYTHLFNETDDPEFDTLTQQALEIIFHGILVILERQCKDQLPGGVYWNPTTSIKNSSNVVPLTNKASESDFAILDLLVRTKPNASVQTIQALTMWANNKTSEWLDQKSDDEKNNLQNTARVCVNKMRKKYDDRKRSLLTLKNQKLEKKQSEKTQQQQKEAAKKASSVNSLVELNTRVWLSVNEAEKCLPNIENENRMNVLIAQLNFYRHVVGAKCSSKLFNKTKMNSEGKRENLSWEELFENLKIVIENAFDSSEQNETSNSHCIRPFEIRNAAIEQQKKDLMSGIMEQRLKQKIKNQQNNLLSKFKDDPTLFVGKIIQHRVKEEDSNVEFWEKGKVIGIDKVKAKAKQTTFFVSYENEPDKQWSFPLLIDFEKGDIVVIS